MTETEWLHCTDPQKLLTNTELDRPYLLTGRKLRLFCCACCRRVWDRLTDPRSRLMVEVAERFADGEAEAGELASARGPVEPTDWLARAAWYTTAERPEEVATAAFAVLDNIKQVFRKKAEKDAELRGQCGIVRDLFSPYARVKIDPEWLRRDGESVRRLAEGIYAGGRFEMMPVLADALQEAGCRDRAIIDHCRTVQEHYRGCHLLDAILGRS